MSNRGINVAQCIKCHIAFTAGMTTKPLGWKIKRH